MPRAHFFIAKRFSIWVFAFLFLIETSVFAYHLVPSTNNTSTKGNLFTNEAKGQPIFLAKRRKKSRLPRAKKQRSRKTQANKRIKKQRATDIAKQATPGWATKEQQSTETDKATEDSALKRGARVEFDARLVQGQRAQAGAIYLFGRKRSKLSSMVQERKDYRKEILRTVFPLKH